jgi:4-alpha-glucanotransferase
VAERPWLADWARYAAAAETHGSHWTSWPAPLRDRDAEALAALDATTQALQARAVACEWLFEQQWAALRSEASRRGVALVGDVPIFVGGHAADVWAHRGLFRLDAQGHATVETGVPPDAFSVEGQRWGTPHYEVEAHVASGYAWWTDRLAAEVARFDEVRIDHFRGLAASWEVPVDGTPVDGRWTPGLGAGLLAAARERLGGLPFLAEDLGVITPDVEALRDAFGLRGMAILQFGFSDARRAPDHTYLPHRHRPHLVVYPGTHDNAPVAAWYAASDEPTRDHFRRYTRTDGKHPASTMLRLAWRSVADTVVVSWQDVLGLGAEGRMNTPGLAEGNWAWRTTADTLSLPLAELLAEEARLSGR